MNIEKHDANGLNHSFSIKISAEELNNTVEAELVKIGKTAKIQGFRPGKVPMSVLKQRYGKDVMGEAIRNAIDDACEDAIEEKNLRPVLQPDVKISDYVEGGDLKFEMNLEVLPELPKINIAELEVDEFTYDTDEIEVEQALKKFAEMRTHLHTKDGEAEMDDVVKIDFVGKQDGIAFEGGSSKNFSLHLGSGQFIPGFEEQLVGLKAGDTKTINVTFPAEYHSESLAGKPATFDITVHEVSYRHTPDLSDDLAQEFGLKDLNELKNIAQKQVDFKYAGAARAKAKKALFDKLDAEVKFTIPEKMLKLEFDNIWEQIKEAQKYGDKNVVGKSDAELETEYKKIAERRVKLGILLSEIGAKNNITVSTEDLQEAVMSQARMYPGNEKKVFDFYHKNPAEINSLRGPIIEEKTVDFILKTAKKSSKKLSKEELFSDSEE